MPVYLICVLIFMWWLWYERNKHTRLSRKSTEDFWIKEDKANHARNKSIEHLPYITIDVSLIPAPKYDDECIASYKQVCHTCSQKMIDLSEYSNTDLKLTYGIGHFKLLTEYDTNYGNFLQSLSNLASTYMSLSLAEDAITCYLLCIQHGSKKLKDYVSLANLYLQMDQPEKVVAMISDVSENETIERKKFLLSQLKEILASYQ